MERTQQCKMDRALGQPEVVAPHPGTVVVVSLVHLPAVGTTMNVWTQRIEQQACAIVRTHSAVT